MLVTSKYEGAQWCIQQACENAEAVLVCLETQKSACLNRESHTLLKILPNPWLLEEFSPKLLSPNILKSLSSIEMKCRKQDMCSPVGWTLQSAATRSQGWEGQLWNDQVEWILFAFSGRDWKSQRGIGIWSIFMAWIFLIMRESYLFLVKMVLSQASLCTVTQKYMNVV